MLHFAIKCGGSVQNSENSKTGTIGIFGIVNNTNGDSRYHVALHMLSVRASLQDYPVGPQ